MSDRLRDAERDLRHAILLIKHPASDGNLWEALGKLDAAKDRLRTCLKEREKTA